MDFNRVSAKESSGSLPMDSSIGISVKTLQSSEVPVSRHMGKFTGFVPSRHRHNSTSKLSYTDSSPLFPISDDIGARNPPKFKSRYSTSSIPNRSNAKIMRGFMSAFPDIALFSSDEENVSLVEATQKELDELHKKLSAKDVNIKELEEKLVMQKFESVNEYQAVKLEMEQLIADNKIKTENQMALDEKISSLETALVNAKNAIKTFTVRETELQKKIQKFDFENKRLEEKINSVEQEKEHERKISDQLRIELENKKMIFEKLAKEKSNFKSTVENLENQLRIEQVKEDELTQIKECNEKLCTELAIFRGEKVNLENRIKTEIQLRQDMEVRLRQMESSKIIDESSKDKFTRETMHQQMEIEQLSNKVAKLKDDLEMSEKKSQEFKNELHLAQKSAVESQLERDESILTLKRTHSVRLLSFEDDQTAVLNKNRKKLQEVESENALLEAKYKTLSSQLSIVENANAKALDIKDCTITSLEDSLKQTRDKLVEMKEDLENWTEVAGSLKIGLRQCEDKLKEKDKQLTDWKRELEDKEMIESSLRTMEKNLQNLKNDHTRLECEKGQLQMKLNASEEKLKLLQEQRIRSLRIKDQTIEQLEKQTEDTQKRNRILEEKLQEAESRLWNLESNGKDKLEKSNDTSVAMIIDDIELKGSIASDGKTYKEHYENEKTVNESLLDQVKDLEQRNKDGGKAFRKILKRYENLSKRNEQLEATLKIISTVREQMKNAVAKILNSLEQFLEQVEGQQDREEGSNSCIQTAEKITYLERMCEVLRNTQRNLNKVKVPQLRKKLSRTRTETSISHPQLLKVGGRGTSDEVKVSPRIMDSHQSENERKVSDTRYNYENIIEKLKWKLDVEKEVSYLQSSLKKISHHNISTKAINKLEHIRTELQKISSRTGAAREETAITLKKCLQIKCDLVRKIEPLTRSLALDSPLDNAISKVRCHLEESNSKLSQTKRIRLSAELDGLIQKKEQKLKELKTLDSQLIQLNFAVQELTDVSEQALKQRLLTFSLISEADHLMKNRPDSSMSSLMPSSNTVNPERSILFPRRSVPSAEVSNPSCPYCCSLNSLDQSDCKDPSFLVNCWKCHEVFFVQQQDISQLSMISIFTELAERNIESSASKLSETVEHLSPKSKRSFILYDKLRITGLTSLIINNQNALNSFYETVFHGREINSQVITLDGDVDVSVDTPVTTEEISEMQITIKSLQSRRQKVPLLAGNLDNVILQGILGETGTDLDIACHGSV